VFLPNNKICPVSLSLYSVENSSSTSSSTPVVVLVVVLVVVVYSSQNREYYEEEKGGGGRPIALKRDSAAAPGFPFAVSPAACVLLMEGSSSGDVKGTSSIIPSSS